MILDRGAILGAPDLRRETVAVPEWGEGAEVIIQEMCALDRDKFRQDVIDETGEVENTNIHARILVRCIVDSDGNRLFTDDEAEVLGRKSQVALQRLLKVAERLNEILPTEDAIKNSVPDLNESLPSDSV